MVEFRSMRSLSKAVSSSALLPGGFDHRGYHTEDSHYESFYQQQDRRGPRQENQTVRNPKTYGPVSPKTVEALGQLHKQWLLKSEVFVDG
jgi:hypothetical protein